MVQFLLENKADVDAQDKSARTPVKVAHDFKRRDITDLLIQHGSKRPADLTTEMFKKAMKKYCDLCRRVRVVPCGNPCACVHLSHDLESAMSAVEEAERTEAEDEHVRMMAKRGTFGPLSSKP